MLRKGATGKNPSRTDRRARRTARLEGGTTKLGSSRLEKIIIRPAPKAAW